MLASLALPLLLQVASPAPVAPIVPPAAEPEHHLVVVTVRDAATLDKLLALDLDLASCQGLELPVREVDVIATDADIAKIKSAGLTHRVEVRQLEDTIAKRLSKYQIPLALTPAVGQGAMGGHYTLAQAEAILDGFAKKHPTICTKKVSLGKSIENRDIWMLKISDNVQSDENEPEVLFDAIHHAREPLSLTTTLQFMDWLLSNYGKDPEATFLVDNREMYFVPIVNPDGYEYNYRTRPGGGGMWRKNRRNNGSSYGVDLNRNWPTGWSAPYGGNSTNPSSSTYRGTSALSEPETLALENFIKSRKFVVGCSCHTSGDILLHPYGYQNKGPTNLAEYQKIASLATAESNILYGVTSQILYVAAGGALDHYHEQHGMFGFTPELGRRSEGGFWPSPPNQVVIANRHQHMFKTFARVAGATVDFDQIATREGTGSNSNGIIEPGERGLIDMSLSNAGAAPTVGAAKVTLTSKDPTVTVVRGSVDFGVVAKFASPNKSAALEFGVQQSHPSLVARLELTLSYDGIARKQQLVVPLAPKRTLVTDDFETDLGFQRSNGDTATTGKFERAAPQATLYQSRSYQPGNDHTPGPGTLCWVTEARAGTSAGSYDVDTGHTSFVSPILDLSHVTVPELRFWLYFSESTSDDPFLVEVSDDGGKSWEPRYSRKTHTSGWEQVTIENLPSTKQVQLRFWTQDLNASLVEACVDDLELRGLVQPGDLTLLGSAARGTTVRLGLSGEPGGFALPLLSGGTIPGITIPGITGQLQLDLQSLALLPQVAYGTKSSAELDLAIPQQPSLLGLHIHLQQLFIDQRSLRLGNPCSVQVK